MKQRKIPTLTIAVPAFNEEANIGRLLEGLLRQEQKNFKLKEIIVRSDGSSDGTVREARRSADGRVRIIDDTQRLGLGQGQNYLLRLISSDIVILVNADVAVIDDLFISKLVAAILSGADLVCPSFRAAKPASFYERVIWVGLEYQKRVYEKLHDGNNWYTCRGALKAMSKKFYKNLVFPHSVGEDLYTYFACVSGGFKYQFVPEAIAYYRRPANFSDHRKQNLRFQKAPELLEKTFGRKFVKDNFSWPVLSFFVEGLKTFFDYPLYAPFYPIIYGILKVLAYFKKANDLADKWQMATSSKTLVTKGGQLV